MVGVKVLVFARLEDANSFAFAPSYGSDAVTFNALTLCLACVVFRPIYVFNAP